MRSQPSTYALRMSCTDAIHILKLPIKFRQHLGHHIVALSYERTDLPLCSLLFCCQDPKHLFQYFFLLREHTNLIFIFFFRGIVSRFLVSSPYCLALGWHRQVLKVLVQILYVVVCVTDVFCILHSVFGLIFDVRIVFRMAHNM